jgi:dihydropteroate synthase
MYKPYLTNGKQLSFEKAHVMAIVNITPDSFYDGGRFSSVSDIIKDVERKIKDGATIIDVGAVSSKPNGNEVSVKDELVRLKQPLILIRKEFPKIILSVDTYLASVAEFAIDMGADMINDISGGELDENMIEVIAKHQIAYIMMHMQGTPQNMQQNPTYDHVTNDVFEFLKQKTDAFQKRGVEKLIIDMGFGFGKTVKHNYQLLKDLKEFNALNYPILVGLSRKSMINKIIHTTPETALTGTIVLNTIALQNGAKILRVHDVKEAKQAIDLFEYYQSV